MFIVGVTLVLSSALATVYGGVSVFRYRKLEDNYLTSTLIYPANNAVKVLTQMDSVETWLALKDCSGAGCEPIDPTYTAIPVFPCDLAAYYKCQVVGKGKPVVQSLCVDLSSPLVFVPQILSAVDYINGKFPSILPNGEAVLGVVGLGPICPKSCLAKQLDSPAASVSILQNAFKLKLGTFKSLQYFHFTRSIVRFGTFIPKSDNFRQRPYLDTDRNKMIPIIPGACSWTFKLSSSISIYASTAVGGKPFRVIRKPASITYDPNYTFNIVSKEMAEAYADAFNTEVLGNTVFAHPVPLGDLMVFPYVRNSSLASPPNFPAFQFSAINALGQEILQPFIGAQGFFFTDSSDLFTDYLPFAYRRDAPCCQHWILGYPSINYSTGSPGRNERYPQMVVEGTTDGIEKYHIRLTPYEPSK